MANRTPKPQVPAGKKTTLVRTQTDWQDGTSKWAILRGAESNYDRLPGIRPPLPQGPLPAKVK